MVLIVLTTNVNILHLNKLLGKKKFACKFHIIYHLACLLGDHLRAAKEIYIYIIKLLITRGRGLKDHGAYITQIMGKVEMGSVGLLQRPILVVKYAWALGVGNVT